MNERIEQLAEQATEEMDPEAFSEDMNIPAEWYQKFAELIAKKCAVLAMTQHHSTSPADYDEMDPYDKGCDDTASRISGLIRRTFGVEE